MARASSIVTTSARSPSETRSSSSTTCGATDACCEAARTARPRIGGFLEDYAYFIDGLLALYRATLDGRWLDEAMRLVEMMIADFAERGGRLLRHGVGHETPVARPRDLHDGATPSGNAVAADVLLRLGAMTGERRRTPERGHHSWGRWRAR